MEFPVTIQKYINAVVSDQDWKSRTAAAEQLRFFRDRLPEALCRSLQEHRDCEIRVISEHTSKSCILPVVVISLILNRDVPLLHRPGESVVIAEFVAITVRDNLDNVAVSVNSTVPIVFKTSAAHLFDSHVRRYAGTCDGFPSERIYGSYAENKRRFTVGVRDRYALYTLAYLLREGATTP